MTGCFRKSAIAAKDETANAVPPQIVIIYHGFPVSQSNPELGTTVEKKVATPPQPPSIEKEDVDQILGNLRNTCPLCEKEFKDEKQVERHVRTVHQNSQPPETQKSNCTMDSSKEEVDQMLEKLRDTCPFCEKRFRDEKQVERHVRAIHKRPYNCDKCRRSYFTSWALEEHQKTHSNDFYFECPVCHLKYKRKEGLKHHQIRVHSDLDPKFMCDHCGKRFKLKVDLLLHIGRAHMNNIQICRFCGKAVKDLTHHEWRHEKIAKKVSFNYACHLCPKKFRTNTKLDNHLLLHKEGFKCELCNEVLRGPAQLVRHKQQKHKPGMLCTICEKTFQCRSNFYQHVLTHEGVRPYKCDVCGEDFTQRSSLLRHRRNHPGPLPPLNTATRIADIARSILAKALNA